VSRQPNGSGRYYVTLDQADADALEASASAASRPPTTEAGLRIVSTLHAEGNGTSDALAQANAEVAELKRQLEALRVQHAAVLRRLNDSSATGNGSAARPPRWAWPIEDLLSDGEWWSTWLPHLHEILGAPPLVGAGLDDRRPDERGYVDLMAHLFPPVRVGTALAEWHGLDYPAAVRGTTRPNAGAGPTRADMWQAVIRHVAVALAALAQTEIAGADPLLRIRTVDELTGPWARSLRRLTGNESADLPGTGGSM
jgi:hypothetical protein